MTEEANGAPLVDAERAGTFRSLERAVDEIIERDHARGCEVCDELTTERERRVVLAWAALDGDEQARWLQAWGMTDRGAAMREALRALPPENLRKLMEMAEQAAMTETTQGEAPTTEATVEPPEAKRQSSSAPSFGVALKQR